MNNGPNDPNINIEKNADVSWPAMSARPPHQADMEHVHDFSFRHYTL
jgi:hypothetical protein